MSLRSQTDSGIPEETIRVAKAAFPKNNIYMKLRDELGTLYSLGDYAPLFGKLGRPAESPVILILVSIFQFIEGLSDRGAADAVRGRIDWKYALGLELTDPGFDFSVLSEFRGRLISGGFEEKLLDDLLTKFEEKGLLKAGGRQRTDSTHVMAAIRTLNRFELVGETLRFALNTLSAVAPEWVRDITAEAGFERYEKRFENYRLPKSESERMRLALTIGRDGYHLLNAVFGPNSSEELRNQTAVEILRQVWIQQYYLEEDRVCWRKADNMPSAERLIQSPYDPEARFSRKRETEWTGYKCHMTETCDTELHVVTNVETTPATLPDSSMTDAIHTALNAKDLLPNEHLADAGYVDAELVVISRQKYDIDIIGPVPSDTSWQARAGEGFDISSFAVDWDRQVVTCPQGRHSHIWSESSDTFDNPVVHVRFSPKDCQKCCERSKCTQAKSGPRALKYRPQDQHEALQYARQRQNTSEFRKDYGMRAGVEGTLSQGIRGCGLRNTRYIGQTKTRLQNILIAVAINLMRFANWLYHVPHAVTRTSAFAASVRTRN